MQDWNGNKASAKSMLGVNYKTNSTADREQNDYYATDPVAVRLLCQKLKLPHTVWECACGAGHLSEELIKLGYAVYSSDLIDRGYGLSSVDFLKTTEIPRGCKCILTNPPYKYANEFILHALELLPLGGVLACLLNLNYLSGITRFNTIYKNNPPACVYVFAGRVKCAKNGDFSQQIGNAINYAWFVWVKGNRFATQIDWIEI